MSTAAAEQVFVTRASCAQRRLWLLSQLEPDNSSLHICSAVELRGELDATRLRDALQRVIDRHEALRTTFTQENGEPKQVISARPAVLLPVEDLPESAIESVATGEFDTAFSLLAGPLLRVRLLRVAADRHVLLSVLHHIIADGWSMSRMVDEMVRLYRGETLEPLGLQYADFAEWQHEYLSGPRLANLVNYWTHALAGAPALSRIATDRPCPARRNFASATLSLHLDQPLAAALIRLAHECGATLFMTLLAAYAVLLHRHGANEDLIVGTPIANRARRQLEPLIGMFVNTLPLRIRLGGNPTFRQLLTGVRQTALDAYQHQDLPFEQIVEALQPGRTAGHTPLFQTVFALQNAPRAEPDFAGLQLRPLSWGKSRSLFDLTMILEESDGGIGGSVEYSTELFDQSTIAALCRRFRVLLSACVSDPDAPIAALDLLDSPDHEQLQGWCRSLSVAAEQTIPAMFEAKVRVAPDAAALIEGERMLTYRELDERSSAIAQAVLEAGIQPDTPVAVSMDRSFEQIAAILGILKAGASYLSLEPDWPAARIESLIRDSGAVHLPHSTTGASKPLPSITPGHSAYISYTSGSTGVPKGVRVPHRAVARLVKDCSFVKLNSSETVLCFAPLSFDASTIEIWGALLNGARLVLAPPHATLEQLARCIRTHRVTTCWLSAGLFQAMVEEHLADLAGVRQLMAGGDVLSPRHVARFLESAPGARLINGYGPTENTTFTSCHPVASAPAAGGIPIGRPVANTSVFIVDRNFQLAPPGMPGELVTGGDGLAIGYIGRPAATAASFVPNPFGPEPGSRLYRTGDLARWRSNGVLEFLGRLDHQVKIRGFRVEPAEVEAALMALQGIAEAAVAARGEDSQKRLVAWVVPRPGVQLDEETLLASLKEGLAGYLVPSAVHFVAALPLSASGKVDRGALVEPATASDTPAGFETPTQSRLAALWSGLLPAAPSSPAADFFAAGGHSLLASQLVSRIRREFGVEFPLRQIFDSPVLRDQAAAIDRGARASAGPRLPRPPARPSVPLTRSQRRLWLLQQLDLQSTAYNVPIALRLRGVLDRPALVRSLQAIIDRHDVLRTCFPVRNGEPVQSVVLSRPIEIPVATVSESEAARRIEANAAQVFDLAQGPLLRVELLRLSAEEHILLTSMHHVVCDGWSAGIFVAEWQAFYSEFAGYGASGLKPLPIQYADYAAWEQLRSGTGKDYWIERLRDVPPLVNLPADRPRPAVPGQRGALHRFHAPVSFGPLGDRAATTPFMTALAVFGLLLARYSGHQRVVIASAVANRQGEEVEPLIGCFVNTLPLTVDTSGDPSFLELLARVRRMSLDAYAHQEVPFEEIVESLPAPREIASTPLAQIGFALQTFSIPSLGLPGLELELIDAATRSAKAEMTLMLTPRESGLDGAIEYDPGLFDGGTIRSVAAGFARLAAAAAAQPELSLSELLEKSETGDMPLASLPENRSNLTRSQMLTWLGQRLRPADPLYNIGIYFTIPAAIDAAALRAALETVVRSSDALRTVFYEEEGVPRQVALDEPAVPLEILDFSADPNPDARMRAWAAQRVQHRYDLSRCSIGFALATLGPTRSAWYIGIHHLVGDGLAVAQVFRLVSELYPQALSGTLPHAIKLPAFQDHVSAERRLRFTRHYRAAEAFWKKQLERPAEPIAFFGRPARHRTLRVESLVFELGVTRSQQVRESAAPAGSSNRTERRALYDFFGAVLCTLVHRISGAPEIAVGVSFHNRHTRQAKETIGHFMSVIPIRLSVEPEADNVASLASRFGSLSFQAFRRSAYTVGNPPNRRNYEVFYNYQINTFPEFAGQPVESSRVFTGCEEDTFALHITDYGESGNIGVQMDFSASSFTAEQRRLTVTLFERLIDAYLENPGIPLDALPLVTTAERSHLLSISAPNAYPITPAIHSLFEEQARRHPHTEAVIDGGQVVRYGELNGAATLLAARLQNLAVAPEVPVAVLLERGVGQLIGLLAVLKAGGAYVPIDAALPGDRIHYLVRDCGARVVVTDSTVDPGLIPPGVTPVLLDRNDTSIGPLRPVTLAPGNAAYVIYTSGSTGRPKGVVVSHSALVNAFHAWRGAYGLDSIRRHLQMANFSFDVFTGDWIRALCSGGTLILCPRTALLEPVRLHEIIETHRVDCAEFVPAVASALATYCQQSNKRLDRLALCIAGSDTWTAAEYRQMQSVCGAASRLINSYGVTEAAIDSSYYQGAAPLLGDSSVPIGRPFPNMRLLILDRRMEPVPAGVPGELYVGGDGLARGYFGKPALTAERFVPDPSGCLPGARLYRTGDRARQLPGGDIEFLARLDSQVKVRGYRVELPEIEAVMLSHPGVRRAAAVLSASRIVAYVEPDAAIFDATALRATLAATLPEYMVPAQFAVLPNLPLTPSGKVDRRALPEALPEPVETAAPRNDTEARLAEIWKDVLRVPVIGIHDNFFESGGHSLLATQIISRVNHVLNVSLPLRSLFEAPTVAGQAALISAAGREEGEL